MACVAFKVFSSLFAFSSSFDKSAEVDLMLKIVLFNLSLICLCVSFAFIKSAVISYSINELYLDEFHSCPPNIAEDFYRNIFPSVTCSKNFKIVICGARPKLSKNA